MDELTQRVDALEKEVYRNQSISRVASSIFNDFSRGNLQFPIRDALPATCQVGEVVEVSGSYYGCSAQDTWSKLAYIPVGNTQTSFTAGEGIDASSTSKYVYIKASDGKVYLLDSDADESTYKFIGVVGDSQNVSTNGTAKVATSGIIGGFSGLTAGDRQYASATAGVAGTVPILLQGVEIAIAVSATQVYLVNRSPFFASGTDSVNATTNDTTNIITIGFRPRVIFFYARITNNSPETAWGWSMWNDGSTYSFSETDDTFTNPVLESTFVLQGSLDFTSIELTVSAVSATGFSLFYDVVNVGGGFTTSAAVYYLAIG